MLISSSLSVALCRKEKEKEIKIVRVRVRVRQRKTRVIVIEKTEVYTVAVETTGYLPLRRRLSSSKDGGRIKIKHGSKLSSFARAFNDSQPCSHFHPLSFTTET
jgi:hypothetical protein